MKVKLENSFLKISLVDKGAELKSVIRKDSNQEYMWSGDPSIWGKTSPILFPIVGTLKNNTYTFNNISYQLARHGFARDCVFEIETQAEDRAVFLLKSNPETFENYPFHFELRVTYSIEKDILRVDYQIK
ncbi:MAG: aldose 1-epimerase family protein, partial [Ginsengibacter sp.]